MAYGVWRMARRGAGRDAVYLKAVIGMGICMCIAIWGFNHTLCASPLPPADPVCAPPASRQAVDAAVIPAPDKAALRDEMGALARRVVEFQKAAAAANKALATEKAVAAADAAAAAGKAFVVAR